MTCSRFTFFTRTSQAKSYSGFALLLLGLALSLTTACASSKSESTMPAAAGASFGAAESEAPVYAFDDDSIAGEVLAPPDAAKSMEAIAELSPDEPPAAASQSAATNSPPLQAHARQLVYDVALALSVRDPQTDLHRAEKLATAVGGWVQSVDANVIVMRIPASALQSTMSQLEAWGRVLQRTYRSTDVTSQYVDLETRIRVLRETQAQLLTLLTRANTVQEALAVRKELDALTLELETALGRMRLLQEQVAFSKITLDFQPEQGTVHEVDDDDPFPWVDTLGVEVTRW